MSEKNNSKLQVFKFATIVCLLCSLVVSIAVVSLRGLQERNALNEKRINILVAAGLAKSGEKLSNEKIDQLFRKITPVVVNLKTGELVSGKNPVTYDMYKAAQDPKESHALVEDPASIKRIAKDGSAYLLIENHKITKVILPVEGYGLWSTLYGFTSLVPEASISISGLTFYKHGETPGLGARITDPKWQKNWQGVLPYGADGNPRVAVVKNANPNNRWQVDAISGATLTSRGVQNLMNFWLGKQGYLKFIKRIKNGEITASSIEGNY